MSSPLLKGGVLLSQIKGAVEEAPNDGWAYARYWNGSDYVWDNTPYFNGPMTIGEQAILADGGLAIVHSAGASNRGTYDMTGKDVGLYVENTAGESGIMIKSGDGNVGQFIHGADDVYEMYMGWYASTHGTSPQKWEMVANHYQFFNTSYTSSVVFKNSGGGKKSIGINAAFADAGSDGILINDWGNSSLRIEDATSARIDFTSGATDIVTLGFDNAGDGVLYALGDLQLSSSQNVEYYAGLTSDHIWYIDGTTTEAMRLKGSSGYLGIGATGPARPLEVVGDTDSSNCYIRLTDSTDFADAGNTWGYEWYSNDNDADQLVGAVYLEYVDNGQKTAMDFYTRNAASAMARAMRIDETGKVSIGSPQTTYHFGVYGSSHQYSTVWSSGSNGNAAFIARGNGTGQAHLILSGGGKTPYTDSFELIQDNAGSGHIQTRGNNHIYIRPYATLRALFENVGGMRMYGSTTANRIMQMSSNSTYYNQFYANLSDSANYGYVFNIQNLTAEFKMTNTGAFDISESGSQTSPGSGYGRIWVKNAAPSEAWYTDDTGVSKQISMKEGTWTPNIWDASYSSSESQTYSVQSGDYWVVGNLCFFHFDVEISSLGTLTTTDVAYIGPLPVTASSGWGNFPAVMSLGGSLNITAGYSVVGRVIGATDRMRLEIWDTATGTTGLLISELSVNGRLIGTGWYRVQ